MMDFWPWITRNDLFFELYLDSIGQAMLMAKFYPIYPILVFLFAFFTVRYFPKKTILYSIFTTFFYASIVFGLQNYLAGNIRANKVSDAVFLSLMNMWTYSFSIFISLIYLRKNNRVRNKTIDETLYSKIQSSPFYIQILIISSINTISISFFIDEILQTLIITTPIILWFIYFLRKNSKKKYNR
jgi:hypothetical protein